MSFKGPQITKLQGGLGRRNPSQDNVIGLVLGGVVTTEYDTLGTIVQLLQVEDAEALGFTASYDSTNDVQVYYHISEFFRLNPDGTLYISVVAQGTTQAAMLASDGPVEKMALHQDNTGAGSIKYIGLVLNPAASYAPTITDGLDADVSAAIPAAQTLIDALAAKAVYLDGVMIEGRNASATITDYLNLRTLDAANVSVVIAADPAQVALNAEYAGSAAVGSAVAMIGVRKVNEDMGSVNVTNKPEAYKGQATYPLTSDIPERWQDVALSSGELFRDLTTAEKEALQTRGYIVAGFFQGDPNIYFWDGHTCVELASDYAYINLNRVWNKAARAVRAALIPKIRGEVDIEAGTGRIGNSTRADWTEDVNSRLDLMMAAGEISSYDFYIDPNQNVISTDKVKTQLSVGVRGTARTIESEIGLENPFNS